MDDTYSTALRWPESPDVLIDTARCPACFTPVTSARCSECDLELTDARLSTVLLLARKVHTAELARRRTLRDVRTAQRQDAVERDAERALRAAAPASVALVSDAPLQTPAVAATSAPAVPSPAASRPAPAPATPSRPARVRPRISVPVLLLVIGVCLVGIAAIFFLTVAWFVASIEVRALIIGGVTALTLVTASVLRRRRLGATAEAIAVIGVVLLALDAWAVRANGLLGAETLSATLYAGIATLAISVIARLWSWLSALRSPDIASVIGVPVGCALVVGGAVELPVGPATVLALVAAGVGGLTHTLPAPWSAARPGATAERTALASIGVAALTAGALTSPFVALADIWFAVWCTTFLVVVAAAYTVVLRRPVWGDPLAWAPPLRSVAASAGVAAASCCGWQLALRDPSAAMVSVWGIVIAVGVLTVVSRVRTRLAIPRAALVTAAILAALSAVAVTLQWLSDGATAIALTWQAWFTDPALPPTSGDAYLPLVGATLAAVLLRIVATDALPAGAARVARTARPTIASVLILAAATATAVPVVLVGAVVLVCGASVAQAHRHPRPAWGWAVPAALGAGVGCAAGFASPWLWAVAVAIAIATALVLAAVARTSAPVRAGLVVVAVAIAAISAFIAPYAVAALVGVRAGIETGAGLAGFALLQWVALLTLAAAVAAPATALDGLLRRVLAVAGLTAAALSLVPTVLTALPVTAALVAEGPVAMAIGEPWAGLVRGAALLCALATIAWSRVRGGFPVAVAAVAALLLAPTAGAVVIAVCDITDTPDAAPPVATAAFALLCLGGAIAALRRGAGPKVGASEAGSDAAARASASPSPSGTVRLAADAGALIATALVAWQARSDLAWLVLLLIGAAVGAVSITRGWAAPRAAAIATVPTVRGAGMPLHAAPRRLLVWPAFGFVVAALWSGLGEASGHGATPSLEAYTAPPAVALVLLAAAMTWLRRHAEAATAIAIAVLLGLGVPATWLAEHVPARPITATVVAAALAITFAWTPARRLAGVSVAGASSAVAVASAGALLMSQWSEPLHAVWAAVPAAAAFAAAVGFARTAGAAAPSLAQRRFATVAPAATILLGAVAVAYPVWWREATTTGAIALAVLLALSVVAAAVGAAPLSSATRVSALAGATLVAAALLPQARAVELVGLPFAVALLAGAALAMRRRSRAGMPWPAAESTAWLAGLAVAVLPSVVAAPTTTRSWLLVLASLLAATGIAAVATRQTAVLASASVAVLMSAVGVAGLRALVALPDPAGIAVPLVAGAGITAVGAVTVWRRLGRPALALTAAAAGPTIIALTVALRGEGDLAPSLIAAIGGGAAAIAAASVIGRPGWRGFAGTLSIGATVVALTAVGLRVWRLAADGTDGLQQDLWVWGGCALVAAVGLVALHSEVPGATRDEIAAGGATPGRVGSAVGAAFASVALAAAVVEGALIVTGAASDGTVRVACASMLLSAAAVGGALLRRRIGAALLWAAGIGVGLIAVAALVTGAADPVEVVTLPPAIALLLLGVRRLRRDATVRTWSALGPGLTLLTVPSLMQDLGPNELWRIVALGVVAVALVVVGATRRLQAPLVIGAVVLLIHAVAQLWPWIATSYDAVPWWLWVGLGGILLIVIAARYERQLAALRTAYASVTSLR